MAEEKPAPDTPLRTLVDAVPDGVLAFDREFRYTVWNAEMERISGVPRAEALGRVAFEVFPFLTETGEDQFFRDALAGKSVVARARAFAVPETGRRGLFDAHYSPLRDAGGEVCGGAAVVRDVTERCAAEDALRESEERYRSFIANSSEGIWRFEMRRPVAASLPEDEQISLFYEHGYLAECNDATARMYGYERAEEIVGTRLGDLLVRSDPRNVEYLRAFVRSGYRLTEVESVEVDREGNQKFFSNSLVGVVESGRLLRAWGTQRDETERRAAEEALKLYGERYQSLLENANDIIYSHDLEGNYLSINRACVEVTGYTREEILGGLNIAQVVAPEHLGLAREMLRRKLSDPSPTVYEIDILTRDRRRLTLEVSTRISYRDGRPVAVEGVGRDVTERKRAEAERARLAAQLEGQRRHLQAMVARVPGLVWEAWGEPDAATQRIDFISDYVETMLGYTVEEWTSTPNFWLSIVHPEDRERAAATAAEHFARGVTGTNRFRWLAKDGRVVHVETHSSIIKDEAGRSVGMRGVTMDITERVRAEANERFLAEASTALSASLDYETTLATVARLAVPHFADWCAVDVADEAGTLRRLAVAHVDPRKVEWAREIHGRYPPDRCAPRGVYRVLRTGESEFYPEVTEQILAARARDAEHLEIMRRVGLRSVMLVPLRVREQVLGVITFANSDSGRAHAPEDLALAEDLAGRAALAVDNARLYRAERQTRLDAERTADRLARLQAVSTALSHALTPEQVGAAVIEHGVSSLGAHAGSVFAFDESGAALEIVATAGLPAEAFEGWRRFAADAPAPLADAAREKRPVIVESIADYGERYPVLGPLASVTGSNALVALPLIVKGRTIGAMGLSFPRAQTFGEDDRAFMLALAEQCAQALERARLYETERQLRAEAEESSRLKDEFLATVSHELRTPLTAIVGWSNILRTGEFSGEETARALEVIERNAKAQARIIEDILDVSRIITGKLRLDARAAELSAIVGAALESVRPAAATKGIRIEQEAEPGIGLVWGDPARLQQVMWNLLSNAVKFTPAGGRVGVRLGRAGGHLRVTVSDTGEGISPEFLPYVFDRFRQADGASTRPHGGLGLGLSIVRQLVELHGGSVKAESAGRGHGATFTVNLPVMPAAGGGGGDERRPFPPPPGDAPPTADDAPALAGVRVLIVDDEADTRSLLTALCGQSGAQALAVASAAEALDALAGFRPDVLISDIGMPGEDGYTLIRRLRSLGAAEGGRTPAVALTAYAREEDRMRALLAGYQVHVSKPVNPAELVAVVVGLAGVAGREKR